MPRSYHCCAVLPARDEAPGIAQVIQDLRGTGLFDRIIVCDNGSTDDTAVEAREAGAEVVHHPEPGYGGACLRALAEIKQTDIVVFVDADNSLRIDEAAGLIESIHRGADLAIGARVKAWREKGSMTLPQTFGNWLACWLIAMIWRQRITDLGPFRAIRFDALSRLDMQDQRFGWTVEMQVKAIQQGLSTVEVPVHYRRRIGQSKISGTVRGVVAAAQDIIGTILKLAFSRNKRSKTVSATGGSLHR